jgi:hypothetical protein
MKNALLVILVAYVGHTLLIDRGASAEEVAKRSLEAMNNRDYPVVWSYLASQSKLALEEQLNRNRAIPIGRMLIGTYGIHPAEIDKLTPYTNFVAIMHFADGITPPGAWESRIVAVDVDGNVATMQWKKRSTSGTSRMVREEGEWKVVATVY